MGEVTVEATVLTVTPIQAPQGQTMVQLVIGEPFKGPVTFPLEADREIAGITVAIQRSLSQIPGLSQQVGMPRLTLVLSEPEYMELGRPRYPDRVTVTIRVHTT